MTRTRASGATGESQAWLPRYLGVSKKPLTILAFLLPLVVAYEIGLAFALRSSQGVLTNKAHVTLLRFFDTFGISAGGGLYLGGLLRAGKVEHESDDQGRADWEFRADGITELFDVLDTLATDTIPGVMESTTLPTTLRLEGSYQFNSFLGLGVVWEDGFGGAFDVGSSVIGVVEFRLAQWLPIRVGGNWLRGFGTGLSGGLGLDFSGFELNLALSTQGGIGDTSKSAIVRTGLAFFF